MTNKTKIYLDNCCLNRPFDNQEQIRIQIETKAKLHIQELILNNELILVWSYILDFENEQNPYKERKKVVNQWKEIAKTFITESKSVLEKANQLLEKGIRSKDALHIACAINGECDFFLTTDDLIIKKMRNLDEIKILNPTEFITQYEEKIC